jgi:spore germination cell wall hydrolase CwlJ-like protein
MHHTQEKVRNVGGVLALAYVCCGVLMWELSGLKPNIHTTVLEAPYVAKETANLKSRWRNRTLTITNADIDVVTRTLIGEAANEPLEGQVAVVHVILNRARQNIRWYGGRNLADVCRHKVVVKRFNGTRTVYQFEPWMHSLRRTYLWELPESGALYKRSRDVVERTIRGEFVDTTNGATHFLEPNIVKSRTGGSLPSWAQGNGIRIGNHVFFKPHGVAI